jgi:putative transposase
VSRYIDEHRGRFGVEPICRVLDVSASAYYHRATGQRSQRAIDDERLLDRVCEVHAANYYAYGYRKMWLALKRAGETVGRDHVKRLMRAHGIQGAKRRGKPWRTTIADAAATRSPDLVNRDFTADRPDALWVADFTYVRCYEGMVFFSFVIDVYSRRIVGWRFASHMRTDLVLDALRMALTRRQHGADVDLIHHSDAGSQGELIRSSQHRVLGGWNVAVDHARDPLGGAAAWLSSRRLARRAGRSGDSQARSFETPPGDALPVVVNVRAGSVRPPTPGTRPALRRGCASRASFADACSARPRQRRARRGRGVRGRCPWGSTA